MYIALVFLKQYLRTRIFVCLFLSPEVSEETMLETLPHIAGGKYAQENLDREFRENRDRRAYCPWTREHDINRGRYWP